MAVGLRFSLVFLFFLAVSANSGKKVDMGTQTDAENKVFDYNNLSITDLLRCGGMVVALLYFGTSDKRGEIVRWQQFDSFIMVIEGLALYFFPQQILETMVSGKTNHFHVMLSQVVGAIMIGNSFTTRFQLENASRDSLVRSSWLISRLFGGLAIMLVHLYTLFFEYQGSVRLTDQCFSMFFAGIPLYQLLNLCHLFRYKDTSRGRSGSAKRSLQICILLHIIMIGTIAFAHFGMNDHIFKRLTVLDKPDAVHCHYVRLLGAFNLVNTIQLIFSLKFDEDADRKSFLGGQLMTWLFMIPLVVLYQWKEPFYSSSGIYMALPFAAFNLAICLCGFNDCKYCTCITKYLCKSN